MSDEPKINTVDGFRICDPCLDGKGGVCNTPGCYLCRSKGPDIPIRETVTMCGSTITPEDEAEARRKRIEKQERAFRLCRKLANTNIARLKSRDKAITLGHRHSKYDTYDKLADEHIVGIQNLIDQITAEFGGQQ